MRHHKKQKSTKGEAIKIILSVVGVAGLLGVAVIAPNILSAFARAGMLKGSRHNQKTHYIRKTLRNLEQQKLVQMKVDALGKEVAVLTPAGESLLARYRLKTMAPPTRKAWDGKWRFVSFDVPEHERQTRDQLRAMLRHLGFAYVQRSLWVSPHPYEGVVALIEKAFSLEHKILYMTTEKMREDRLLREKFGLYR